MKNLEITCISIQLRIEVRMKIAVTGASGMIGSAVTETALKNGYEVIAIVRPHSLRNANLPASENLKIIESDISDIGRLTGTESCDMFFHLAWRSTSVKEIGRASCRERV